MRGTVAAIERDLVRDGFVLRYASDSLGEVDGLPGGEGAFLPCTFWLADNYVLRAGRDEDAALFERLLGLRQRRRPAGRGVRPGTRRLLGNFPQAFTHVALINTAHNLAPTVGPADARGSKAETCAGLGRRRSVER